MHFGFSTNLASLCAVEGLSFSLDSLHDMLIIIFDSKMSLDVKFHAVKTSVSFICHWMVSSNQNRYIDLLVQMVKTLLIMVQNDLQVHTQVVINDLIVLAKTKAWCFGEQFENVVESMFMVLEKGELQWKTRLLGLEFVITLAKEKVHGRGMLLQFPRFIKESHEQMLKMLSVKEDDLEWENAESDDKDN